VWGLGYGVWGVEFGICCFGLVDAYRNISPIFRGLGLGV